MEMHYVLTIHAAQVLEERDIPLAWLERAIEHPEWVMPDPRDPSVQRHFRRIPEFGNRVLRVAVNTAVEPARVVSIFFDRNARVQP